MDNNNTNALWERRNKPIDESNIMWLLNYLDVKKKSIEKNAADRDQTERVSNPGIKPGSPALAGGFFTSEPPGKPQWPGGQTLLGLGPQKGTGAEAEALAFLDGETLHRACAHSFLSEEAFLGSGILHSWTWKEWHCLSLPHQATPPRPSLV